MKADGDTLRLLVSHDKFFLQVHQERIDYRQGLMLDKLEKVQEAKLQALQEQQERIKILKRIAALVPYAERISNIQADPTKMTISQQVCA